MKYLLTAIILLSALFANSQSTVYLRADTITAEKGGGNATFKLKNATRDSVNGVLLNIGGGVTEFKRIRAISASQFVVGTDTITISGAGGSGSNIMNADLTATGNRYQNFTDYTLHFDSLQSFTTNSYSGQDYTMLFQNGTSMAMQYANSGLFHQMS